MGTRRHLDRIKHDMDIYEHVVEGLQEDSGKTPANPRTVDVAVGSWFGGNVTSTVEVEVVDLAPDEPVNATLVAPQRPSSRDRDRHED
jgi:hypothetical protein